MLRLGERVRIAFADTYIGLDSAERLRSYYTLSASQRAEQTRDRYHAVKYAENSLTMMAAFLGLPIKRLKANGIYQEQSLTNLFANLIGWEYNVGRKKILWNCFWALPTLIANLLIGVVATLKNTLKLAEFLFGFIAGEIKFSAERSRRHSELAYLIPMSFFATLHFIMRSMLSPWKGLAAAWQQGRTLGSRHTGKLYGGLLVAASLLVTAYASLVLIPLTMVTFTPAIIITTIKPWLITVGSYLPVYVTNTIDALAALLQPGSGTLLANTLRILNVMIEPMLAAISLVSLIAVGVYCALEVLHERIKDSDVYSAMIADTNRTQISYLNNYPELRRDPERARRKQEHLQVARLHEVKKETVESPAPLQQAAPLEYLAAAADRGLYADYLDYADYSDSSDRRSGSYKYS